MALDEVFPNPIVRQVVFQIRFPSLFYLESKMGEFQIKIMRDFPKSSLTLQRQFMFAQGEKLPEQEMSPLDVGKIWNFQSQTGIELHVRTDSLDLTSTLHKTYNNPKEKHRFRDSIEQAVGALLNVVPLPVINRIGLRYIDNAPVPALDNNAYQEYYNSTLALDRFNLAETEELSHTSRMRCGELMIRMVEDLHLVNGKPELTLDYDASAVDIESGKYLSVTDKLHELIIAEFQKSIREPVLKYMRRAAE